MTDAEVVVVGAGPAGASAAYHLARSGLNVVLIEQKRFPRDKACGDALTKASLDLIGEMDAAEQLTRYQQIRGVEISHRHRERAVIPLDGAGTTPRGLVVPRAELDALLVARAVDAGATFRDRVKATGLAVGRTGADGVVVLAQERTAQISARFVVAADGAAASFTRRVRPASGRAAGAHGFAARAYYSGVRLDRHFYLHHPLTPDQAASGLAGYGWAFPIDDDVVNIGVGMSADGVPRAGFNLRATLLRFADELRAWDRRFAGMRRQSAVLGAPLRYGDDSGPEVPGVFVVGDAAGLIDPYTGEGIGAALGSGKAAAQAIAAVLHGQHSAAAAREAYESDLAASLTASRRERPQPRHVDTAWRIMSSTLGEAGPTFVALRRELSAYAVGGSDDTVVSVERALGQLGVLDRVEATRERVATEIRTPAQLVARTLRRLGDSRLPELRAALLFVAAGPSRPDGQVTLAASLEAAYLATLLHQDVLDDAPAELGEPDGAPPAVDANRFLILAGDHLLGRSQALSAQVGAAETVMVSDAIRSVWAAVMARTETAPGPGWREDYVDHLKRSIGPFYVLPCLLGTRFASRTGTAELERFAAELAVGVQLRIEAAEFRRLVEVSRAYECEYATRRHALTFPMLHSLASLPLHPDLDPRPSEADLANLLTGPGSGNASSAALRATEATATRHLDAATAALAGIADVKLRDGLGVLSAAVRDIRFGPR